MNFVSYNELCNDVIEWTKILPRDFDLIVGVPRSGMLPALLLSLHYNIHVAELGSFKNGVIFKPGRRGQYIGPRKIKNIFVVDDSSTLGNSIDDAKKLLKNLKGYNIKYGALYVTKESTKFVDYHFRIVNSPRIFQWNYMHHPFLENSCSDIDGVLCIPPTSEQNDDGKKYIHFLQNTKPISIPTVKIKILATCRLEKYRKLTQEWLSKYNIKYDKLVMMNYPNMKERQKANIHAEYKANIYRKSDTILFIEDEINQAKKIAQIARKPVLCVTNWTMYK